MPLYIPRIGQPFGPATGAPARQNRGRGGNGRDGLVGIAAESAHWQEIGPVRRGQRTTLDASGNGSITFSVFTANSRFLIESVVVKAAGAVPQIFPQVTLYNGLNQQDARSQGASWLGGQVTFRGFIEMNNADDLTVGFAKGVAGTVLTAIIEGTNYLWR